MLVCQQSEGLLHFLEQAFFGCNEIEECEINKQNCPIAAGTVHWSFADWIEPAWIELPD